MTMTDAREAVERVARHIAGLSDDGYFSLRIGELREILALTANPPAPASASTRALRQVDAIARARLLCDTNTMHTKRALLNDIIAVIDGALASAAPEQAGVNWEAWAKNAAFFIAEKGLKREFQDWSGGWPCPAMPEPRAALASAAPEQAGLLATLSTLKPLGDEDALPSSEQAGEFARVLEDAAGVVADWPGDIHDRIGLMYAIRALAREPETQGWRPITKSLRHRVLVTNNIGARDAYGQMSHIWIGHIIKSDDKKRYGKWVTFTDGDRLVEDLTHYCEIPQPAPPASAARAKEET